MSEEKKPAKEKVWEMPQAYRGQIVLWYEGGVRNENLAMPALVKVASHSSLVLKVFGDHDFNMDCVRHMSDPEAREGEKLTQGLWDFCKE